jgi:ribulose-5-phosphate 4-epimerase/fuculose-1-phosphate aldolase
MRDSSAMSRRPLHEQVSRSEWEIRVDLAAFYRLVALHGMTDLVSNHITARVPGKAEAFLINPYGMAYEEITASSLMKVDLDGRILLQPDHAYGINPTGYIIHSAIHAARPDLQCIAHTHTRAGIAVSAMSCGLLPLSQTALRFHGNLGYHEFEGFALDAAEKQRLIADLGKHDNMILRNHGLLACGRTLAQAFVNLHNLELACRSQVDAMAAGAALHYPSAAAIDAARRVYDAVRDPDNTEFGVSSALAWAALLRQLDRSDASYRT